jgi:probable HAF family extracellular repeat protein
MSSIKPALPASRISTRLHVILPRLLAGAVIAAAATATVTGRAEPRAVAAGDYPASTFYRVVNLGAGDISELPAINVRDQVSFSLHTQQGSRGFFYDGKTVRDIGTLGGATANTAGLNDAGQVVGRSDTPGGASRAFVWSAGAGMAALGVLPGASESAAFAINNQGVVAGYSDGVPATPPLAFRWSAADGMRGLGAFTGGSASFSVATALNDAGLIAGNSDATSSDRHAFAWTQAAGMIDIDSFRSRYSAPAAVARDGRVAGYYSVPGTDYLNHAFLWSATNGMRDLGTAGGVESFVLAMSPNANIAGVVNLASGDQHAMAWTESGGMVDLGTLDGAPPGTGSRALGVNKHGTIVGWARNAGGTYQPFAWTAGGGMVELNARLRNAPARLVVESGLAISDNGVIVAESNAGMVLLLPMRGNRGTHALGPVVAADLVAVGEPLDASVHYADEDMVGMRGASWSWGDGGDTQPGALREGRGAGSASASHRYAAPGIYPVTATLVNRAGRAVSVSRQVVVHAPAGGIVGGSGAVLSAPGALKAAPLKAGKASFRFVAPSAAGTGALQFQLAGWGFRSDELHAAAGGAGQFEGRGKINGRGDYRFALATTAATAAQAKGRVGLKIWHVDPATQATVVDYDSSAGRPGAQAGAMVDGLILQR